MEKNINKLFLILIIFLAFALRFYRLDSYPALNADEAAIGYNAYSLIQTGKDEHSNSWPVHFQSFNDYKPGLYFYIVLPFVKVLGLNEWAVRIPGATLGVLTVFTVFFLVNELCLCFRNQQLTTHNQQLGLIASLLLAISPWHIHFSRGGWEVNCATFFVTAGILFFLKGLKNNKWLIVSCGLLVASLYTYHAARVVVPLLLVGLYVLNFHRVKNNYKSFLVAGLVGLILIFPLTRDLTKGSVLSRAAGVGLFADPGPLNRINEQRGEHNDFTGLVPKLIHNKAVNYGLAFLANWVKHYHGEFLFLSGDEIQRDKVPETGALYLFDIIFLLAGILGVVKQLVSNEADRDTKIGWLFILFWLGVAPVASALTFQSPSALRAHNMVIPLTLISANGMVTLMEWFKKYRGVKRIPPLGWNSYNTLVLVVIFSFVIWNFARYLHEYYVHMAKEYPYSSQYGIKELASYIESVQDQYKKIIVTNRYDQPYILFLFYSKYPPAKFQNEHTLTPRDNFGFSTVANFDKYYFGPVNYDSVQPQNPNSLIIGTDAEIPKEANIVKKIYGTNAFLYFEAVAN